MNTFLYFPLKNSRSSWLIKVGDLENVCCIDPIVRTAAHHMVSFDVELKNRYLDDRQFQFPWKGHGSNC